MANPIKPSKTKKRVASAQKQPEGKAHDHSLANSAADIAVLAERLNMFSRDELARIPIVPDGQKLKTGVVYLDLRSPAAVPFTATDEIVATEVNHYAAKIDVPDELWNRLVESFAPAAMAGAPSTSRTAKPFSPERAAQEAAVEKARPASPDQESVSDDAQIDEASMESFPASDPPSWTTGREQDRGTDVHELRNLSDRQLNEKARELNINSSAMDREQLIEAIRGELAGTGR